MKISHLVEGMTTIPEKEDCIVNGLCCDSREIKPGDCFFALAGAQEDGRDYISVALQKGAAAIVVDNSLPYPTSIPSKVFTVPDLAKNLGNIASRFYQNPSKKLKVIGLTGTNGKTSTSQYIAMAMKMANRSCGIIGTLGYGLPEQLKPSSYTTSFPLMLQKQLAEIVDLGAEAVAMEVSSHALDQHRTQGVEFDIAVFTNLTRDHLDYHGTMENYAAAKKKLFLTETLQHAVINIDDPFGLALAKELQGNGKVNVHGYSLQEHGVTFPLLRAHHIHLNSKGVTAKISSSGGEQLLRSKLLGRFNISNLLAVLCCLQLLDIPIDIGLEYISQLNTIPGRMQVFGGGKQPLVIVDYAHTPDALKQVLQAIREHTHGTLWCLFGCGGDRDQGKRPIMAQIAERFSDQLVITDDNPRTEDPSKIVADMMNGLLCPWAVEVEHDRGAAIAHVIDCAAPGDVILVAGKGHENYQLIGDEKLPFSDAEQIQAHLRLRQKHAM